MLFSNQWVTEEIKKEIKIYLETNENENAVFQSVWEAEKAVLRAKFMAIKVHFRKQEKDRTDNLNLHLKQLEKEEQKPQKIKEGKKS